MSTNGTTANRFAFDSPAAALDALLARIEPVETETAPWSDAAPAGPARMLGAPIVADRPSPASDVSSMDGYAVRFREVIAATPGRMDVADAILPGRLAPALPPGKAMRIMTGAVVPEGADCVIRREDVGEQEDHITLTADTRVSDGLNIRRRGENITAGEPVVPAGVRVSPAVTGAIATFGCTEVTLYRALRVQLIITGDEVHDIADNVNDAQIRDSNGPSLDHLIATHVPLEWMAVTRAADEYDELVQRIRTGLRESDALILTGGVSMGTHDFVPDALREAGCDVVFHKLPQRPGKPVLGAVGPDGQVVMGLPGNPMSVMCTGRRLAVPALAQRAGLADPQPKPPAIMLEGSDEKTLGLWWHRAVRMTGPGRSELVMTKGSGDVASMARSDGFVEIPPDGHGTGPWPYYAW